VTGPVTHTLVAGADWSRFEYDSQFFSGRIDAIDISRPTYRQPITGVFLLITPWIVWEAPACTPRTWFG
jgi:hypothetical protein